jgi:peroxiredoxin
VFAVPTAVAEEKAQKAKVGQPAPAFSLPDQNGKTVSLSDHKGKVVVLEWFNPGCPYVQKFYENGGQMNEFAKNLASKDVVWLAINTNKGNTPDQNKQSASKWQIDRPILSDADAKVAKMYGAKTTPHMYVIDKDGTLVYAGAIDDKADADPKTIDGAKNYVLAAVAEVQAGKEVSTPETKSYGCGVKY